jgi:hypothetical protein
MEIKLASENEYLQLMEFIDTYWRKNHCLVKSKMLFDWQHKNGNEYNFYIAKDGDKIVSALGLITPSHHDKSLPIGKQDFWGAIWKTIEDPKYIGVGISLMRKVLKRDDFNSYGALGISDTASHIYKAFKMNVDVYSQYYIANDSLDEYNVSKNPCVNIPNCEFESDWEIKIVYDITSIDSPDYCYLPKKNKEFFINRYQLHPVYKYFYWYIYEGEEIKNVWVMRRIVIGETSIFRVIDIMGNLSDLPCLYNQIQQCLKKEHGEYVDFVNYGIDECVFSKIGFNKLDVSSEDTIIPNYFEPFLQKNINIGLAYKSDFPYVAFKADGDQDRPSML